MKIVILKKCEISIEQNIYLHFQHHCLNEIFIQLLDEKQDLLSNAEHQNLSLKDELARFQESYEIQREYFEPQIYDKSMENAELQRIIQRMELELHEISKPVVIGQHDIEKKLRIQIHDLEEELFHAKRKRRKLNIEDSQKYARDFSEEDRLKRELKELQGRLKDQKLRQNKLERYLEEKDAEIKHLRAQCRDLEAQKAQYPPKMSQEKKLAGADKEDLSKINWKDLSPEARSLLKQYDRKYGFQKKHVFRAIFTLLVKYEHMFNRLKNIDKMAAERPKKQILLGTNSLSRCLVDLLKFVRRLLIDIIFEMFVRSANHAYHKKINSLILFIINIKELKERSLRGLLVVLKIYLRIRHMTEEYCPDYQRNQVRYFDDQVRELQDIKPELQGDSGDQVGKWILGTLGYINKRKQYDKSDQNKEFLYLFRCLAIKYRIKYPLSGKEYRVDEDLGTYLEDKICSSFLRIMESSK